MPTGASAPSAMSEPKPCRLPVMGSKVKSRCGSPLFASPLRLTLRPDGELVVWRGAEGAGNKNRRCESKQNCKCMMIPEGAGRCCLSPPAR